MNSPNQLDRFIQAQQNVFKQALAEIRNGRKQSHWMWYIFPQLEGLAHSPTAEHYAIKDAQEAKAYLAHPLLGQRLHECAQAMLDIQGRTANEILGSPDDLKLKSCATLFANVLPVGSVFECLLEKYYQGQRDIKTLRLLDKTTSTY